MKVFYIGKLILGRRFKALLVIFIAILILYLLMNFYRSKQETSKVLINNQETVSKLLINKPNWEWSESDSNNPNINTNLRPIPAHIVQEEKCPACYGNSICDDINNGDLQIEIPKVASDASRKGVFFGRWQGKDIAIKTLDNLEFNNFKKYDEFICQNQSLSADCDVSRAILNPRCIAVQENSFLPQNLQQTWKIAHNGPGGVSFSVCATTDLIQEMSQTFDDDHDGQLNEAQVAMLYTSMVLNPEAVLLKFFSDRKADFPIPRYLGACGRIIVAEHGGLPLSHFFSASFQQRAELALQALEMIHMFIHADPNWFMIYGDMKVENFAVSSDGQLTVIDVEDMGIIDKRKSAEYQFGAVEYSSACNAACIGQFAHGMMDVTAPYHSQYCIQAPHVAGMAMYALLCSNILAEPLIRQKVDDTFFEGKELTHPGLLHHPPSAHEEQLADVLFECIEESAPGGRLQAVEELKTWLEEIVETDH